MVLKKREKFLVGAVLLIGLVMGFDQFLIYPKKKTAALLQAQLQETDEKIAAVTTGLANLQVLRKRVEEKKRLKDLFSRKISDRRQIDLLLEQLARESREKRMDLMQLTLKKVSAPRSTEGQEKEKGGEFVKVEIDALMTASYGQIAAILEGLQSLPIFQEVERIEIQRKEEIYPRLEIQLKKNLYIAPTSAGKSREKEG